MLLFLSIIFVDFPEFFFNSLLEEISGDESEGASPMLSVLREMVAYQILSQPLFLLVWYSVNKSFVY